MKKIRLLFLTLVALLGMALPSHAADVTVYIDPVGDGTWTSDDAKISLNVFTDGQTNNTWIALSAVEGNVLKATFDDSYNRMIIVRGANQDAWGWNQTENITPANNKLYKANGYTGSNLAYTVSDYVGYSVDFNTSISTSSNNFAVASNWKHIVGSHDGDGYGPYYMKYYYAATSGIDGSGALNIGAQCGYDGGSANSEWTLSDYLVTPKVSGTVTLKAKVTYSTSIKPYVKFYKVNDEGTVVGEEITATISPELSTSDWSTVTLTVSEATRIAIKGQYVYVDNFAATEAEIVAEPGLTIMSVKRADSESTTYFDANADGTYTVKYKVTVKNTGEVDLVAGSTENYTLSVSIDGTSYGSFDIPFDLAVGATSDEFVASIVMPAGAPTGWKYRYLKENLTGTTDNSSLAWSQTLTYNPQPFFIQQGKEPNSKGASLTKETSIDFGLIGSSLTLNYEIFAHNAGDLTIKSIVAPAGFSATPAETLPFTIPAHTGMNVDVTADGVATASGNLVITYVDKNGADQTSEIALSQTYADPSKWKALFTDNEWPANSIHESSVSISKNDYSGIPYAITAEYSYSNKFYTPLLTATAGESLSFDARLSSSSGSVKVYVTTDRSSLGDAVLTLTSSQLSTSDFSTNSITIDAAGNYYVVFELNKAYVDNIFGLEKVDVAHDIMVTSYKIGAYAEDKEIQTGTVQSFSLDVMPAMAEAAANYTVKLYANNVEVASAEAAALTAGTSKTFNLSWTPDVDATTVYETHAEIEFTDASKIVSPSLNLTVTCDPIFVFFDAGTSVGGSQPSNRSKAIDFGKVNELNQVQNFELYNYGKRNLNVKSITVPAGFAASISNATVEPATRQAVDITFTAATPGTYEGNLTIVYVDKDGVDQNFELAISGTLLDPSKFYATFGSDANLANCPAGSLLQSNVSLITPTTGNAALNSSSSTKNLFITQLLSGVENERFDFIARARSSWTAGSVKVYQITDNKAAANTANDSEFEALSPVLLGEFSISGTDYTNYSVKMPSTGNYYIALKINGAYVDDLYGLTPVDVAHDWQIASSNIPAEGMQNKSYTATVNLLNLGIRDEAADTYSVTLFVDDAAAATGTAVAIPMSHQLTAAGTELSVSFVYPKTGTVHVYLKVASADGTYSVQTDPVNVTFADEVASGEQATGESAGTDATTPLNMYYKNSETIALYTASQLGLSGGEKISSIAIKGYSTKAFTSAFKVYYEWTDATSIEKPSSTSAYDVTGMTEAINEAEYAWSKVGSSSELGDMIVINFGSPIVYEANKSLKLLISSSASSDAGYNSFNFEKSTTTGYAYQHQNDGTKGVFTGSWNAKNSPLLQIGIVAEAATLTGAVKNSSDAGIEGATVTLKADNGVEYSGTTAADGSYSINVIQAGLAFTTTVEKDGYLKKQFALNMGGASKTNDVVMYTKMGIVGDAGLGLDWDNDQVMTQSTEDPNIFTLTVKGVNIAAAATYEYKLRADGAWNLTNKYELPNVGNQNWEFGTTMYPTGTYNLIFTANTTAHTLTLQPVLQLTLADSQAPALDYENAPADVTVGRTLKAGWNAMVLPFDVTAEEIAAQFGANAQVAEFTGDEKNGDKVSVNFAKSDVITANVPFLLYLEAAPGEVKFLDKSVTFAAEPKVAGTKFDFVGLYADGTSTTIADGDYIMAGGMLKCAAGGNAINAYRSYLKLKEAPQPARISIFMDGELIGEAEGIGEATGIQGIGVKQAEGLYNMGGQKVTGRTKKGVYIQNGKKVVIK